MTLDGAVLTYSEFIYIMPNQSLARYISATEDERPGEHVVTDLLPPELLQSLSLWKATDTTGLIIATDDGVSAHRAALA